MKLILLTIALIASSISSFAQINEIQDCIPQPDSGKYITLNKGFDETNIGKIQLVSGDVKLHYKKHLHTVSSAQKVSRNKKSFELSDCQLSQYHLKQLVTLDSAKRTEVFALLNDNFLPIHRPERMQTMCYYPRNALIFYNKEGKIFAILEICFQCKNMKLLCEASSIFSLCDGDLDRIFELFKKNGIKYGITER